MNPHATSEVYPSPHYPYPEHHPMKNVFQEYASASMIVSVNAQNAVPAGSEYQHKTDDPHQEYDGPGSRRIGYLCLQTPL
jgi:hypothetical protein